MKTIDKNTDKIIKEKFEDFQVSPPSHVWRNIKGSVAGGSSMLLLYKFFGTPVGVGVSIVSGVAIALLGYNVLSGDEESPPEMTERNINNKIEYVGESDIISPAEYRHPKTSYDFNEVIKGDRSEAYLAYSPLKQIIDQPTTVSVSGGTKLATDISGKSSSVAATVAATASATAAATASATAAATTTAITPASGTSKGITEEGYLEQENPVTAMQADADLKQLNDNDVIISGEEIQETQLNSLARIIFGYFPFQNQYPNPSFLTTTSASDSALFAEATPPIQLKDDYGLRSNLSFGIFYAPEKIYYPSRQNQKSNTFDINGIYHFSNFLVQSGIGISFVEDLCDYDVNYNKWDVVGSYFDVDTLGFDSITGNPIYVGEEKPVYDSVSKSSESNTINKYTYLRIPIIFGYQKDFKRFSYHIKGGPVLNILVKSTEPEPASFGSDVAVQSIDRLSPGRINTYWQLYMGMGLTYHINHKIGILVEPTASYNLSTIYERNYMTSKRPYSIGIRTGILISF